ncbi:uncharacterized protein N7515_008223 [Penicillium bovifimosum]|uniref:Wax synthase domain-containing protein n=1 Tax=Penicillium bovifimosum TaxID=126998 RepID=A0A9W9GML1_9EURO|nr:uncharacterized protein N7515_008223 [Penicillium bovifimosum]KAJ5124398.1 hypothetical protein N7515_008223 [Penicillium bovifimosum]
MYGLHNSTVADITEFACFYLIQTAVPATLIVTTRKGSPLRHLCVPCMIWIAGRFIRPYGSSGSPAWCQAITQLIIVTLQATNVLLLNPLDNLDISREAKDNQSFVSHFVVAFRRLTQTRAIDTRWQVKNVPSHPAYYARRDMQVPVRNRFLLRQLAIAAWQYLVLDIVQTMSVQKSMERDLQMTGSPGIEWMVPVGQWAERIITHLSIWFVVNRLICDLTYRVLSILFVGIGSDWPSDWPPVFGRMADVFTLRNFWGTFWHQFMRQPFTSISDFVARRVLCLQRHSKAERYTNLFIVFLISAVLHVVVDVLQSVPAERSGSMVFYLAFVPGIMFEDAVQGIWKQIAAVPKSRQVGEASLPAIVPPWKRAVGYIWVMLWLGVTSTWYFTPMIQSTQPDMQMVPFSVTKCIGLDTVVKIVVGGGAVIALVFEVEI